MGTFQTLTPALNISVLDQHKPEKNIQICPFFGDSGEFRYTYELDTKIFHEFFSESCEIYVCYEFGNNENCENPSYIMLQDTNLTEDFDENRRILPKLFANSSCDIVKIDNSLIKYKMTLESDDKIHIFYLFKTIEDTKFFRSATLVAEKLSLTADDFKTMEFALENLAATLSVEAVPERG
ncbi:MAG: hypothetical protein RR540_05040 [Oscillospiraceae bacterium]